MNTHTRTARLLPRPTRIRFRLMRVLFRPLRLWAYFQVWSFQGHIVFLSQCMYSFLFGIFGRRGFSLQLLAALRTHACIENNDTDLAAWLTRFHFFGYLHASSRFSMSQCFPCRTGGLRKNCVYVELGNSNRWQHISCAVHSD